MRAWTPLRLTFCWLVFLAISVAPACGGNGDPSNQPPELTLDVGSQETYIVGEDIIQIRPSATDPEGDPISFEVADKPERAEFTTYERRAYFRWDPIASAVTMGEPRRLTFIARDDHGNRTDRVVRLTIKPGNGQPSFRPTTSSVSYNTNSAKPVTFEVEVRDDNSGEVAITMPESDAPEGADFEQTGPKTGKFSWAPTPVQKETRVHSVTFVADDIDNPAVEHEVNILFKDQRPRLGPGDPKNYQQDCEATLPIEHDALGAQHTLDDYPVEATLSASAAEKYDLAGVLWTTKDAFNKGANLSFEAENLQIDGQKLTGTIPNLQLSSGNSKVVHYQICAIDEQAPSDSRDAYVCSPGAATLYHSFTAYSPDDTACVDDSKQLGGWSDAAEVSSEKWRQFRLCGDNPDIHTFQVDPGTTGYAFFASPHGQPIDFQVFDNDRNPIEGDALAVSSCAGLARVAFERGASKSNAATYYVKVTGRDIPYQTRFVSESTGQQRDCQPDDLEPNDAKNAASLLIEDQLLSDLTVCQGDTDVYLLELYDGDVFGTDLLYQSSDTALTARLLGPGTKVERGSQGLARHLQNQTGETLVHSAEKTGNYHLIVYSDQPPAFYDLDFETSCRDADSFDDNHTRQKAAEPGLGLQQSLKLCSDQPDWFRLEATTDNYLGAELTLERGPAIDDFSLTAYDADGNKIEGDRRTVDNRRQLGFSPSSDGPRYFKVSAPSRAAYSIEFAESQ